MAELTLRERCQRRLEGLKRLREPYEADWKEIARLAAPNRGRWLNSEQNRNSRSKKPTLWDSHAVRSFRTQRQGMTSGLASRSRPWFQNSLFDQDLLEEEGVREWLDIVERRLYDFAAGTNFYDASETGFGELGLFAVEACVIVEDMQQLAVCHPLTIGEYWIAQSAALKVDTLYRRCPVSVLHAVNKFGNAVSPRVRNLYDASRYEEMVEVFHAIEPRLERDPSKPNAANKPWRSVYWDERDDRTRVLRESGYDEKPFWCARWDTVGGDTWSTGPGHDALPDMRELQLQAKRKGEATDYHIYPEIVVDPKIKLKRQPRAVTSVPSFDQSMVAVPHTVEYQTIAAIREDIQDMRQAIDAATYADLFMAITQMEGIQPRNVEEILARNEEKMTQLGSVVDQVNEEKLEVALDRFFGIMSRGGLLPEAPEALQGQDVNFEFVSILTQMQRVTGMAPIERTASFIGNLVAAFPEAGDKFNVDEAIDEYADIAGTPSKIIRSDEDVEAIRQSRASQQQAAQAAAAAPAVRDYADAARLMSETDVNGQPIIDQMLPA